MIKIYHQSVCFTRMWEVCCGVSYCDELVRVSHRRRWRWAKIVLPAPIKVIFGIKTFLLN